MGTETLAIGGGRMFRYAVGSLLLLAGMTLLVAHGLEWLDLQPRLSRALQGGRDLRPRHGARRGAGAGDPAHTAEAQRYAVGVRRRRDAGGDCVFADRAGHCCC